MIPITRLAEPRILQEKKRRWTDDFVPSGKKRPDSSKYAHPEIVETLGSMSHDKCFYCEAQEADLTVDHYIEVAEERESAFTWTNLYLACATCQGKVPNKSIPVAACLDPCDPNVTPETHLDFRAERAKYHTERGDWTIRKYKLNKLGRLAARGRQIIVFMDLLDRIKDAQIAGAGRPMTDAELAELRRFAKPDEPFSLMFACLLRAKGLL